MIRQMMLADWDKVADIYKQGIETGNATFQQKIPTWQEWDNEHLKKCRIIAVIQEEIAGWAALSPVSERCVYGGVAEVSVYVAEKFRGQKLGIQLLKQLIEESEKENLWTLQAGVFPENLASITIHKKLGFRELGYRERIGKMNGKWRNTVLLERRSEKTGV